MLAAAGASDLAFDIVVNGATAPANLFAQIYQADLATIGVKLSIKPLEAAAFQAQTSYTTGVKYQGLNASAGTGAWANLEPPTLLNNSNWFNPAGNGSLFQSDQYTQLVNVASQEPDLARRKQIYSQINDLLLDESFTIVHSSTPPRWALKSNVHGLRWRQAGGIVWMDAWLA